MLTILALCHLVWLSLFVCILTSLRTCSCMCLCVLVVSLSLVPTYDFVHTCLCTQNPKSFSELCLIPHVPSVLQSNGTIDTKSKPTFVLLGHPFLFVHLITCLFPPLCAFFPFFALFLLFACYHVSFPFPVSFHLLISWLCFLFLLHVHTWSKGTTSKNASKKGKMQARRHKPKKGNDQ